MKRKIVGIILTLILISSSLPLYVEAGSEKNPELEDETGECLSSIDIKSVWFFEKPDEPEYLYVNMKLANYKIFRISQGFHVYFKINNESYQVSFLKNFFLRSSYKLMLYTSPYKYFDIYGQVKKIGNIISWKIPKDLIGNPEAGNHITYIIASSIDLLYMSSRLMIPLIIMEMLNISMEDLYSSGVSILKKFYNYTMEISDYSSDSAESKGKDYIIQY